MNAVSAVSLLRLEPSRAPLHRFVERVDVLRRTPGAALPSAADLLPDGTTNLVFRAHGCGEGDLWVRGPLTRAYYKTVPPIPFAVRVVFRPGGAYPFFGTSIAELTDRMVSLEDLWGSRAAHLIGDLLRTFESGGDVGSRLEAALLNRLRAEPYEPSAALQVRAALRLFDEGGRSIDDVALELGISERHLRRAFHAAVGFGPKTYARILRFQRALALGRERPGRWGEVARATGYFDQAHLAADFRKFALASPGTVDHEAMRVRNHC